MIEIKYKKCSKHKEFFQDEPDEFPMTSDFFYKNKTNKTDGFYPYCKRCSIKKSRDHQIKYPEKHNDAVKRQYKNNNHGYRDTTKKRVEDHRRAGYQKEWRRNNRDKVAKYNQDRVTTKTHTISKREWEECLKYFDNSCAYCGLTMNESKEKYNRSLHKEHVIPDGSNGIDNCVPACQSCNSSKGRKNVEDWYLVDNNNYTRARYRKILKWLCGDYSTIE